MLPDGDFTGRAPNAPDFADGWYGYVLNDLRDLYGGGHAYSRVYCGDGSKTACRAALQQSLREALATAPQQLYGYGDCQSNPQPSCFDRNRSTNVSGLGIDPQPFQNRPTFQQAVSITRSLPR